MLCKVVPQFGIANLVYQQVSWDFMLGNGVYTYIYIHIYIYIYDYICISIVHAFSRFKNDIIGWGARPWGREQLKMAKLGRLQNFTPNTGPGSAWKSRLKSHGPIPSPCPNEMPPFYYVFNYRLFSSVWGTSYGTR